MLALVREFLLEKRTGRLVVEIGETQRTFFFVGGDLYLDSNHALAQAGGASAPANPSDEGWLDKVLDYFDAIGEVAYQFWEGTEGISTDLFGPVAAAPLVMRGAVRDQNEFNLLRLLGGEDRLFVATTDVAKLESVSLDPQEAFFLSRLEQPTAIKDVLRQSNLKAFEAAQRLCRLFVVDLIAPHEGIRFDPKSTLLNARLLERFSKRITESLEREPLDFPAETHRQKLANLIARLGGLNFYELLGIGVGATADDIHDAYTRLARVVHPSHAKPLGLAGKEAGIELLFEKATEAYLTLSDKDRQSRYLREVGAFTDGSMFGKDEESRKEEVEVIAERNYRLARQLYGRQDYYYAIELLNQSVRMEARSEYFLLLGRCQVQNPQWIDKAIDSFSRAVQLDPEDADSRAELGMAFAQAGHNARARAEFQAALSLVPGHLEAEAGLDGLARKEKSTVQDDGWWKKLKGRIDSKLSN